MTNVWGNYRSSCTKVKDVLKKIRQLDEKDRRAYVTTEINHEEEKSTGEQHHHNAKQFPYTSWVGEEE